ncbi:MAG TPA: hypothetical protein VKP11_11130, partial [Frankiaceae bacterium]|nr:hypothetical protein [Frankiaceae bacterium]
TAAAVHLRARVGSPGAPFTGRYRLHVGPGSLLAPAVAVAVLAAVRAGVLQRLGWRPLLVVGYAAALGWALALALADGRGGLADPVAAPEEYLRAVPAVGDDPLGFLRGFVAAAPSYSVATRTHPPGPVLLLWALGKLGVTRPAALGLLITAVGCLAVPLIAVSVRSLCHESAARNLLPVLALAPYALWIAVSMDGVALTLGAGFVALGVIGSEPGRRPWWAVGSGLLLGVAALFGYAVAWLGVSVLATYFMRRRPLLNVITGAAALVPLVVFWLWGFTWPDGLTAAQADFSVRVGPHRSWLPWSFLDVLLLLLACGPALVTAARKVTLTPGWPFLVGAGLAVIFALASGMSRGEVERSWLAFYPWLLVPAVAPAGRPEVDERGAAATGAVPLGLLALGAAAAVVVEAVLASTW